MTLEEQIIKVRENGEKNVSDAYSHLEETILTIKQETLKEINRLCLSENREMCQYCQGQGAVLRMDAGYMRKFGLRDWDGCPRCGGDGEKRGRGYE